MVWPPSTHQDVQDEVTVSRLFHQDYIRTGYYTIGGFGTIGTLALAAGTAYARPFMLMTPQTFDRIGVNVTTAATAASGGTLALALWQPGPGLPGAVLYESTLVSSETTGSKEFTITQTLNPGIYWVGARAEVANCTVAAFAAASNPFVAGTTTAPAGASGSFTQAGTGAFPTFTAPGTTTGAPLVSLRAA